MYDRFINLNPYLILDKETKLIWNYGYIQNQYMYQKALSYIKSLAFSQELDWRLPKYSELHQILLASRDPQTNINFGDTYWTSTCNSINYRIAINFNQKVSEIFDIRINTASFLMVRPDG